MAPRYWKYIFIFATCILSRSGSKVFSLRMEFFSGMNGNGMHKHHRPIYSADAADNDCSGQQICEREATRAGMQVDVTKNGDMDPAWGLWSPFGMQDVLIKVLPA